MHVCGVDSVIPGNGSWEDVVCHSVSKLVQV